jgi:hypothetical protein
VGQQRKRGAGGCEFGNIRCGTRLARQRPSSYLPNFYRCQNNILCDLRAQACQVVKPLQKKGLSTGSKTHKLSRLSVALRKACEVLSCLSFLYHHLLIGLTGHCLRAYLRDEDRRITASGQ